MPWQRTIFGRGAWARAVALALPAALASGCSSPAADTGELVFETEHVRYYSVGGEAPCDRSAEWVELFYDVASEFLELPDSRAGKIGYHRVNEDAIAERCQSRGGGCTFDTEIYSLYPLYRHELVHAIARPLGIPPSFFAEGLAEVIGCDHGRLGGHLDKTSIDTTWLARNIARDADSARLRSLAASFVRFLLERFGKTAFLQFYSSVGFEAELGVINARFASVFGEDAEAVFEAWQAVPERADEACLFLLECRAETLPGPTRGDVTFETGCGPFGWTSYLSDVVPFRIGESGAVRLDGTATRDAPPTLLRVLRCAGGNAGVIGSGLPTSRLIIAPEGDYFAVVQSVDEPSSGSLHLTPVERDVGASCAGSAAAWPPQPLTALTPLLFTRRWTESGCAELPWCAGDQLQLLPETDGAVWASPLREVDVRPERFYRCDEACPADAVTACVSDSLDSAAFAGMQFSALGAVASAGTPAHVAAGPNAEADIAGFTVSLVAADAPADP
jgi:hypothetical protein